MLPIARIAHARHDAGDRPPRPPSRARAHRHRLVGSGRRHRETTADGGCRRTFATKSRPFRTSPIAQQPLVDVLSETEGTGPSVWASTRPIFASSSPRDAWVTRRLLLGVRPRRSRWRTGAVVAVIPVRRPTHPHLFSWRAVIPASTTSPPSTPPSSVCRVQPSGDARCRSSQRVRRRQERPRHSVPAQGMGIVRQHRTVGFSLIKGGLVEADLREMSHFYGARSGGRRCDTYPRGYDECALISRIWRR